MIEYWVYTFEPLLEGWETYGVYQDRDKAVSILNQLTKWRKQCKIVTTYDF